MGNEASLPDDVTGSHVNGLQPPSQIPPGGPDVESTTGSSRTQKLKAMFKRSNNNMGAAGNGLDPVTSFRDQEASRALSNTDGVMSYGSSTTTATSAAPIGPPASPYATQQYYDPNMAPSMTAQQQHQQQHQHQQYAVDASTPLQNVGESPSVVGVMYATEGQRTIASTAAESLQRSSKVVRNGGRALLNSMKNLSIRSVQAAAGSGANITKKDENEWQTRWDEDDDSDDDGSGDELAQDETTTLAISATSMDHGDQKPAAVPTAQLQEHAAPVVPPAPSSSSSSTTPLNGMIPPQEQMRISSLAAESAVGGMQSYQDQPTIAVPPPPSSTTPNLIAESSVDSQLSSPPKLASPASVQDGAVWDGGAAAVATEAISEESPTYEKPNVQMFLPLLRVLGKGSFGKVCWNCRRVFEKE